MLIFRYLFAFITLISAILAGSFPVFSQDTSDVESTFTIVVHGGAGTITRKNMPEDLEADYRSVLTRAVNTGYDILAEGGTAIEAVVESIKVMEDSPLFNAGKGAVFTHEGYNELDASIMDGKNLNAGAVAGVSHIKNPIEAALAVMNHSSHVMLTGKGAELFAGKQHVQLVDSGYFYTERRYKSLMRIREREKDGSSIKTRIHDSKFGTVGVVALDKNGNLAAGTSTGGMTNKKYGRIGDSPIIGAGTYADNETCAVSSTGHGEFFIRKVVAYDIAAKMKYGKYTLQQAADKVINDELVKMGGDGGVICIDYKGNIAMEFNTEGMYRGYRRKEGEARVFIYKE